MSEVEHTFDYPWCDHEKTVLGMLHCPPLPGSPGDTGEWPGTVMKRILADARALAEGGVHGLMLENFGDTPFFPGAVPPETIACMTALACEVRLATDLPLGINVLRNDGAAALAVALASGAGWIRVNILTGARLTDQGLIQGRAHELLRKRRNLGADQLAILADLRVKHSAPLAEMPLEQELDDLIERGGADIVVVSGEGTGQPTSPDLLREVRRLRPDIQLAIGSGLSPENFADYMPHADIFIVGASLKRNGKPTSPVQPERVRELMQVLK